MVATSWEKSVKEINFLSREKSGNFRKWSGKFGIPTKYKSFIILIIKAREV